MIPPEHLISSPTPENPPGYITLGLGPKRWRILHNLFWVSLTSGNTLLGVSTTKSFLLDGNLKIAGILAAATLFQPLVAAWYLQDANTPVSPNQSKNP